VWMVLAFQDEKGALEPSLRLNDLVFWSVDLKVSFTLLNFAASDVRHIAVELLGDTLIFFFVVSLGGKECQRFPMWCHGASSRG
jgi:hypothetical protein